MKKPLYVTIPEPCHEDWNEMTIADKGRFCQSCAKTVVDFSLMTDNEILNYFKKAAGNTCGRFANDQLDRPLQPLKQEKRKAWWVVMAMPLLMMFEKGKAQGRVAVYRPSIPTKQHQGEFVSKKPFLFKQRIVYGRVTTESGQPVPFANVMLGGEHEVTADINGAFTVQVSENIVEARLEVSSVGYETKTLYLLNELDEYDISLKEADNYLPPVAIMAYPTKSGKIAISESVETITSYDLAITRRQKLKDTILSRLFSPAFKIYPNPAPRGGLVNIDVKELGSYTIQLFDNSGKPVMIKPFITAEGATQTQITLPASLAAGTYYIRLVDEQKKKQYTDKIIVM